MMELSNFSSLIELLAGLCVAAVAAEVSQGYIKVLFNKIFKLDKEFAHFSEKLTDPIVVSLESVSHIDPIIISGESTLPTIEKTKRKLEELKARVDAKRGDIENNIALKCDLKSFTFFNLFNFILCIILLIVIGFGNSIDFNYALIYAPILIIIELVAAYFIKALRQNMLNAVYGLIIVILLCIPLSFNNCPFIKEHIDVIHNFTIPILCLIPLATFIIYFFIIRNIFKGIKRDIANAIDTLKGEYTEVQKEENELFVLAKFSAKIKASSEKDDDNDSSSPQITFL